MSAKRKRSETTPIEDALDFASEYYIASGKARNAEAADALALLDSERVTDANTIQLLVALYYLFDTGADLRALEQRASKGPLADRIAAMKSDADYQRMIGHVRPLIEHILVQHWQATGRPKAPRRRTAPL
jgi:hypothetical protein